MSTAKAREQFIAVLAREYPKRPLPVITKFGHTLMRLARVHGQLAVEECNGPEHLNGPNPFDRGGPTGQRERFEAERRRLMTEWETNLTQRQASNDRRIKELCADFKVPVKLGGDPRGYTVKLRLPSGAYNTWGGADDGYGVPQ